MENLQLLSDSTTKLGRTASTRGIDAGAQQVTYVGILMYFALVFIL